MKAAVFYGPGDLRVQQEADPHAGPGQVLVRVHACGICGTDRHIYHGEFDTKPPVIIGHEYTGQVLAVGEDVHDIVVGSYVALDPNMPCGVCRPCQRGKIHMCENLRAIGVDMDGGFAELSVVPRSQCYPLPASVSPLEGAMVEPLACCLRGIDQANVQAGDTVAVIGGGAIGLMLAQLARLRGAAHLVLSDPVPTRRQMALALGVDAVVDPGSANPLAPGGVLEGGADVVIEAVGSVPTTRQAVAWAARGGTVLWFGVTPPGLKVEIEPNEIFVKELTIRGARINPFTHSRAISLLASGQVKVAPLITRQIRLDELPAVLDTAPGEDIKTVVVP
ncbi:MAG: zinc-dependent alcohol dehydrogenase family protein [Anaerolineae bacterium]